MADYYPLAIGSKWTYKVTASSAENTVVKTMEAEMTGKENVGGVDCQMKKYTVEGRIVQEECYAWENNKLLLYKGTVELSGSLASANPRPPEVLLVTPLDAGSKWSWSGEIDGEKWALHGEVAGQAHVSVPSGEFDAVLIHVQYVLEMGFSQSSILATRWFVLGVGMVKQTETIPYGSISIDVSNELSSYNIAGGESSSSPQLYFLAAIPVVGLVIGLAVLVKKRMKRVEAEPSTTTTTTAKVHRTVGRARLLASILLLAIAVASTAYLMYPSMPHTALEVYIGSSTSTSTYVSYSTHLTETVVSAAITKQTCRKEDCITRTLTTGLRSSFSTTEEVLSTQYSQVRIHSYITRTETVPPYAIVGIDLTRFALLAVIEFNLVGIMIILLRPASSQRDG